MKLLLTTLLAGLINSWCVCAAAGAEPPSYFKQFMYIGIDGGLIKPVVSQFKHKNDHGSTTITLSRSWLYGGFLGYSFYPQMAAELAVVHHPKYRVGYILPAISAGGVQAIPTTSGATSAMSNFYLVNIAYDLQSFQGFTPIIRLGGGCAQVKIKPASSKINSTEFFRINRTNNYYFAWQAGISLARELSHNLNLEVGVKLQVINNLKIYYRTLDQQTKQFSATRSIKKTPAFAEFTLGLIYKLPV